MESVAASDEQGTAQGWVLIVLMTAGLIFIVWSLAGPSLSDVVQQAFDRITGI